MPRTEAEIHLLRSAMFAAQAIIRDMERTGRDDEIQEICPGISKVAPEIAEQIGERPAGSGGFGKRRCMS